MWGTRVRRRRRRRPGREEQLPQQDETDQQQDERCQARRLLEVDQQVAGVRQDRRRSADDLRLVQRPRVEAVVRVTLGPHEAVRDRRYAMRDHAVRPRAHRERDDLTGVHRARCRCREDGVPGPQRRAHRPGVHDVEPVALVPPDSADDPEGGQDEHHEAERHPRDDPHHRLRPLGGTRCWDGITPSQHRSQLVSPRALGSEGRDSGSRSSARRGGHRAGSRRSGSRRRTRRSAEPSPCPSGRT
jgi:hypothetical protein